MKYAASHLHSKGLPSDVAQPVKLNVARNKLFIRVDKGVNDGRFIMVHGVRCYVYSHALRISVVGGEYQSISLPATTTNHSRPSHCHYNETRDGEVRS